MTASSLEPFVRDLRMPESVRWHDGCLWFCNWMASEIVVAEPATGRARIVSHSTVPIPFSIDWLPDGRLLATAGHLVVALDEDGSQSTYADLGLLLGRNVLNEIVIGPDGRTYVNGPGYDIMAGEKATTGSIYCVEQDGAPREVASGVHFGNGMAITPDGSTLIVAESHAARLTAFSIARDGSLHDRRVWASLPDGAAPDGICLGRDGTVWYADVPNQHCVRVHEGGTIAEIVEADRGCFDCALGGPTGTTLYIAAAVWDSGAVIRSPHRTGQILQTPTT